MFSHIEFPFPFIAVDYFLRLSVVRWMNHEWDINILQKNKGFYAILFRMSCKVQMWSVLCHVEAQARLCIWDERWKYHYRVFKNGYMLLVEKHTALKTLETSRWNFLSTLKTRRMVIGLNTMELRWHVWVELVLRYATLIPL